MTNEGEHDSIIVKIFISVVSSAKNLFCRDAGYRQDGWYRCVNKELKGACDMSNYDDKAAVILEMLHRDCRKSLEEMATMLDACAPEL